MPAKNPSKSTCANNLASAFALHCIAFASGMVYGCSCFRAFACWHGSCSLDGMRLSTVKNGKLKLWSYIENDSNPPLRVTISAVTPKDAEGMEVEFLDWKIEGETVHLEYRVRWQRYESNLPVIRETEVVKKPGRSRWWAWQSSSSCWINTKTGQRVTVFE